MKMSDKIMNAPGYKPTNRAKMPGQTVKPNRAAAPSNAPATGHGKNFGASIGRSGSAAITRNSISLGGGGQQSQSAPEYGARGNRPTAGPKNPNLVVNDFSDSSIAQGKISRGS